MEEEEEEEGEGAEVKVGEASGHLHLVVRSSVVKFA